mgnify:CR=1 FL=1
MNLLVLIALRVLEKLKKNEEQLDKILKENVCFPAADDVANLKKEIEKMLSRPPKLEW